MFTSVTRQVKRALGAVKSVLAIASTAAAALDPKLLSFLREGEQLDGLEPIQLTLVRWIEDDHNQLEEHEAAQRSALRKLARLRVRRDKKQDTLYGKLLRIRKTFEDAFGQGTAAIYLGLEPRLRDLEPQALRRLGQETVTILSDPQFQPPAPLVEGLWEHPQQYADQIRDALLPFEASLDEIESQKREVEKAQMAKVELLDELNERLTWSIRFFEAIYQLAGLGFHAERLRVTVASRSSSGEPPIESGEAKTEGGGSPRSLEMGKSSETVKSSETAKSSETEASAS